MELIVNETQFSLAGFSVKVKTNLLVICGAVNPKLLCNTEIVQRHFLYALRNWRMLEDSLLER